MQNTVWRENKTLWTSFFSQWRTATNHLRKECGIFRKHIKDEAINCKLKDSHYICKPVFEQSHGHSLIDFYQKCKCTCSDELTLAFKRKCDSPSLQKNNWFQALIRKIKDWNNNNNNINSNNENKPNQWLLEHLQIYRQQNVIYFACES